jgi:hypothetical protein
MMRTADGVLVWMNAGHGAVKHLGCFDSNLKGSTCSPKAKLIIELDGSQHLEQEESDKERTEYLESQGYKVIRFWNNDVMNNIEGVILAIMYALEK